MCRHQDINPSGNYLGRMTIVTAKVVLQTVFLPIIGLVPHEELRPGDLIGVNKDSYLILDKLPAEYDARVKAMEVDERPTETYTDIGGLDKQIEELVEAMSV
jgi:26S proteasome regulatory subunit T5